MAKFNTKPIEGALPSRVYNKVYNQAAQALKEQQIETLETEKIEYGLGILEVLLAINFMFELFNASSVNLLAKLVSAVTFLFTVPFLVLFGKNPAYALSKPELATLAAMVIYPILAWSVIAMIRIARKKQADVFSYNTSVSPTI